MSKGVDYAIQFYEKLFPNTDFLTTNSRGYVQVNCIFHNDQQASAYINPADGFYGCFACNYNLQFQQFLKKYYDVYGVKLLNDFNSGVYQDEWTNNEINLYNQPLKYNDLIGMGFSPQVLKQCRVGLVKGNETFAIPVFVYDAYYGAKFYLKNPIQGQLKSWSTKGLRNGLIIPFNLFAVNNIQPVLLCAGEKDMLIARTFGFNAITLTGGEQASLKEWVHWFKDKETYVVYDNDETGIKGGRKIATELFKAGCRVKNIISFHQGMLDKEDIYDYFIKYKHTANDLVNCINQTNYVTYEDILEWEKEKYSYVGFSQISSPWNVQKECLSSVQIRAIFTEKYTVPSKVNVIKLHDVENIVGVPLDEMNKDTNYWNGLFKETIEHEFDLLHSTDMFYLMQDTDKRDKWIHTKVHNKIVNMKKAKNGWIEILETKTIYKYLVGEYTGQQSNVETQIDDMVEFELYSFENFKPSSAYQMVVKPIGHPLDNNKIVLVMIDNFSKKDSIENYQLTTDGLILLHNFKLNGLDIQSKLDELHKRAKSFISPHTNFDLWFTQELVFHSPLFINWNNKRIRGVLHTLIIGDTRTGKSECATAMINCYQQGKIVTAKQATTRALIGGTDGTGNKQFTKAGVIPRNNKGLVVLEEIHGLPDYFGFITDVKSSGIARINRVAGELVLEANVRLLEIANPIGKNNMIENVGTSANGFFLIKNLIKKPEDIARNDLYLVLKQVDRFTFTYDINSVYQAFSKEIYQERIRWAWKLNENDIIFEDPNYIIQSADYLNAWFYTPGVDIFGPETPQKLARLCASLAIILCNMNQDNKVIVTSEIVYFMTQWLHKIYSSSFFALDKVVSQEREYKNVTQSDIEKFSNLYQRTGYTDLIEYLKTITSITWNEIEARCSSVKGMSATFVNEFTKEKLLRAVGFNEYAPTEKFRNLTRGKS